MKRIKSLIAIAAFSLLVLGLPAIASAQWGGQNDPYGRNGGYGNGGYGNYGDMRGTVRNLKRNARELQRHLDRDLDDSRYDGTRREDQLNALARRFRNEVNGLSESNNSNYRRRDSRVDRVLELGNQLDRALSRTRLDYHIQQVWSDIERDLDMLERNSGSYNGGGYNRNNRYPQTGTRTNRPSWWPF